MNNLTKFKKAAELHDFEFYFDRSLKLYALYPKSGTITRSTQYLTKMVIEQVIDIDILINIYLKP